MTTVEELRRAADVLERRASAATPGPWEVNYEFGTYRSYDVFASNKDGRIQRKYRYDEWPVIARSDDRDEAVDSDDAAWIATMSPVVAAPLVAWLRHMAEHGATYDGLDLTALESFALDFARAIERGAV